MYCKFCGGPINRKTMSCSNCGRPAGSLSGGNSFREFSSEENAPGPAGRPAPSRRSGKSVAGLLLCSILCVIGILGIFLAFQAGRSVSQLHAAFSLTARENEEKLQEISGRLSALAQSGAADAFQITKNPTSETNFVPGQDSVAFKCCATGDGLSFSWIKYDAAENSWTTLESGGLYEIESSQGESSLRVINASPAHEGTYICVVYSSGGAALYSAPAQLSLAETPVSNGAQEPEGTNGAQEPEQTEGPAPSAPVPQTQPPKTPATGEGGIYRA